MTQKECVGTMQSRPGLVKQCRAERSARKRRLCQIKTDHKGIAQEETE